MDLRPHIEKFRPPLAEVESAVERSKVFDNPQRAQELSREYARLKDLVAAGDGLSESRAPSWPKTAPAQKRSGRIRNGADGREEVTRLEAEEKKLAQQIQFGLVPPDPTDSRNTIIEIRAGAGGSNPRCSPPICTGCIRATPRRAAGRLSRWIPILRPGRFQGNHFSSHRHGCFQAAEIRERRPSGAARARDRGAGAHPHQHRTVAVLPEAQEVDVEIKPDEIEINVCRASGKGGQGVNTTDSAVQIIHKPTGMIVRCADQRSQQKNKIQAMTVLRSRLLERKIAEENAKYAAHPQRPGRHRRTQRKNPHLQFSAEPRDRSPHRSHALQSGQFHRRRPRWLIEPLMNA
jgi:peptide chain release factor 1